MKRFIGAAVVAAAIGLAGILPAGAQDGVPGVTKTEIKIGHTNALSGPLSLIGGLQVLMMQKYFEKLNQAGGVNGRKIVIDAADDGYNPAKTVEQTRRLVEQDGVLLLLSSFGTPTSAAAAPYLNSVKVPQLFVGSGSRLFNDNARYPWTTGQLPNYLTEGEAYGKFLSKQPDTMKIGVLYQNDDFGKDLLAGLKKGLGDRAGAIVAEQSYETTDPTVDSQIIALQSSGANVFLNFSVGKACIQAIAKAYDSGWKPMQIMASPFAGVYDAFKPAGFNKATGIISGQFLKDPGDPQWDNDPGMNEYREFIRTRTPSIDIHSRSGLTVYTVAQVFVKLLQGLGDNITRESIMDAAIHIDGIHVNTMLPDTTLKTTPDMRNLFRLQNISQFDGKGWVVLAPVEH